jgi:hypothetical protein
MKCSAHRTDGAECQAYAIKGSNVCRVHGGSAPQVRRTARERLLEAADPAAAELVELALRAEDPRVRLAAVRDLLDRAGVRGLEQPVVITDAMLEAEIARLEADILAQGLPLPPRPS